MITKCDFAECTKIVLLGLTFSKQLKSFVMTYGLKIKKRRVYKNFLKIVDLYKNT